MSAEYIHFRKRTEASSGQTGILRTIKQALSLGTACRSLKDEFVELQEEAELLWGTTDWKGDFIPGLFRQELPIADSPLEA